MASPALALAGELLGELRAAGIEVGAEGGELILEADAPPPAPLLARARTLKPALLELLSPPPAAPAPPEAPEAWRLDLAAWPAWRLDHFEERAAILTYQANHPRDLAERLAYLEALDLPAPSFRPELPPGTDPDSPEALALGGDSADFPGLAPGPCPECSRITIATTGFGFCEGCGWARLPAPLDSGAPVATVDSPLPGPPSAPQPPALRAPARQKLPEEKEKRSFGSFSPLVPPQSGRAGHADSTEPPPIEPAEADRGHGHQGDRGVADVARALRRPWAPAVDDADDEFAADSSGQLGPLGAQLGPVEALAAGAAPLGAPPPAALEAPNVTDSGPVLSKAPAAEAFEAPARTVPTAEEAPPEAPAPVPRAPLPPFRWAEVVPMPPARPRSLAPATIPNPLDAPPGPPAIELRAIEAPTPPAPPSPAESDAARAARFGYVITPGGQYIEAHRAHAPRLPPFLPRFDVRWRPDDGPAHEAERQQQRAAARAYCAERLGPAPRPK